VKKISFEDAVRLVINKEDVFYRHLGDFVKATATNVLTLENVSFYITDKDADAKERKMSNDIEFVNRDITLAEAVRLLNLGGLVYYLDDRDLGHVQWVLLSKTSNIPFDRLLNIRFQTTVKARQVSFTMKQINPVASKRNCFEFHNDEFDISIYGKKGTIPCGGKGIRVKITENL
jgi:hypothetical protein